MSPSLKPRNFFNYFPTPDYLLLSTAGIAVSDESVKFVQLERSLFGGNIRLAHYAKTVLSEGVVQTGYIYDADKLTLALREISSRYGVHYAHVTLPEERAYLFTAYIDRVPEEGLRDAVAFIVEENVPVSLANSVFDFEVVEDVSGAPQIKVTVSVLSKKVVDFYLEVFEAAGITPVSFDIESQAIAHAIIPRGEKKAELIINLTPKKTGLYVIEDEGVQFTTTLPYGSEGADPYPHVNDLKTEMRKIFAFWSSRTQPGLSERKIEKVLLCGTGAANEAFLAKFLDDCPVEYVIGNPWVNTSSTLTNLPPKEISGEVLDYASAIGLALPRSDKNHV